MERTVAFVGPGAMAEAMIAGLIRQGVVPPNAVIASGPEWRDVRGTRGNATGSGHSTDNRRGRRERMSLCWR